jgi:hypothetical protein
VKPSTLLPGHEALEPEINLKRIFTWSAPEIRTRRRIAQLVAHNSWEIE